METFFKIHQALDTPDKGSHDFDNKFRLEQTIRMLPKWMSIKHAIYEHENITMSFPQGKLCNFGTIVDIVPPLEETVNNFQSLRPKPSSLLIEAVDTLWLALKLTWLGVLNTNIQVLTLEHRKPFFT